MWRKFLMVAVLVVGLAGLAYAAAEWQEDGVKVNKSEALNFVGGPNVSGNGVVTDVDFSTMTGDVAITGDLAVDGSIYPDRAAADPCATYGAGTIFFNSTSGAPCYCNNSGVDLAIYSATTACF